MLTSAFRAILAAQPADLLPAVYLCTNRVAPAHAGVELGVGDATLIKVCTTNAVWIIFTAAAGDDDDGDAPRLQCGLHDTSMTLV